ncbi:O-methyltransferase [Paenalkalicoccus suaedae]|uniref:tRNA 5-hydroxyuridine methyltransferase n=1 Tax=Paenalkalicoccus suaedae TaxID=2592382 RepID=A0A859FDA5_9BACI|nr:O-methyltransferase [Paenalkalicoccus suaedae]QKS70801.1 O-methyltransferase [Paenalkalicoccus suaedae]
MNNDKTHQYITSLIPPREGLLLQMEEYALENNVPIMDVEGMHVLLELLKLQKPSRILEVGTAIGYSGIRMLKACHGASLVSIERDEERVRLAKENILKAKLEDRFTIIEGDALEVFSQVANHSPYDVLFIDAAKGQYEKFFQLYEPLVAEDGVILSDNTLFRGYVANEVEPESRRMRSMAKKLAEYNASLMNHDRFSSMLLPVGDGLLVTRKEKQ